jgi:hypothetical protein
MLRDWLNLLLHAQRFAHQPDGSHQAATAMAAVLPAAACMAATATAGRPVPGTPPAVK